MESPSLNELYTDSKTPLKLHLGCGGIAWKDFVNVDLFPFDPEKPDSSRSGCIADCYADMRSLKLPPNSVSEIFTSHTLEHFVKWEAIDMLSHWRELLVPGGFVTIETPDFVRCLFWLLHPLRSRRRLARNMFYGNQWDKIDFETHRYVWSSRELKRSLLGVGYSSVKISHRTKTHHPGRDMRVVAVR